MKFFAVLLTLYISAGAGAAAPVRRVSSSSCQKITIELGLGMTTQIVLDQVPKTTLYADKKHFKIFTDPASPRSIAVIPLIVDSDLDSFRNSRGLLPDGGALTALLNKNFTTNLFVFFEGSNQLTFDLRFVDKAQADNIVKVTEIFKEDCIL